MSIALPEGLAALIPGYLGRQRWFGGPAEPDPSTVTVTDADELGTGELGGHRLLWLLVSAAGDRYQLLIGGRPNGEPAEFLHGHEPSVLGGAEDGYYYYDATLDAELAIVLLGVATDGAETAERVRPVSVEQSNTSLVYDDRLIAKVFRRVAEGSNPDVEVTQALTAAGFAHVAPPVAAWRRHDTDLVFVQNFLSGGAEGWALALTSLRDLYSAKTTDPAATGGDFAAEARRLGQMTAEMHLALADAFGVDADALASSAWPAVLDAVETGLRGIVGAAWPGTAGELFARLRAVAVPGPAIRVHGDYHLGQVMRTDSGWFVLDFEGEPSRPLEQRMAMSSPFKDVAAMLRSFQYAAHFVLLEREDHELAALAPAAEAWEARNREAFVDGYLGMPGISDLLPEGRDVRAAVSLAFELDKALYELRYERAYRPDWAPIPETAIQRLLAGSFSALEG